MPEAPALPSARPEQNFDVLVIGAGPAGLSCAVGLAQQGLDVGLIERQTQSAIAEPAFDGREIALTHRSIEILKKLGIWPRIRAEDVAPLKDAAVMDCESKFQLFFDHRDARRDTLGLLVPNHAIRAAAYQSARLEPRIQRFCGRQVAAIAVSKSGGVRVRTSQQESFKASLLIAADSRFSDTRRALGIAADMVDFGKTMLVCRMHHAVSHEQTAWEWFQEHGTVAVLPLQGSQSSIVITLPHAEAQGLQELDAQQFNREIERKFAGRLGAMTLTSTRHIYPLVGTYSRRFVAERCALIGDAAVGMHPVTAHGFNLGLLSQDCLVEQLQRAKSQGGDIGASQVLSRYESVHRRQSLPLYLGTNALVRLYTDARPLPRLVRAVGLRLAQRVRPLKDAMLASLK